MIPADACGEHLHSISIFASKPCHPTWFTRPQIGPLLDKGRNPEDRRIAICVVDDLLEHSPAGT